MQWLYFQPNLTFFTRTQPLYLLGNEPACFILEGSLRVSPIARRREGVAPRGCSGQTQRLRSWHLQLSGWVALGQEAMPVTTAFSLPGPAWSWVLMWSLGTACSLILVGPRGRLENREQKPDTWTESLSQLSSVALTCSAIWKWPVNRRGHVLGFPQFCMRDAALGSHVSWLSGCKHPSHGLHFILEDFLLFPLCFHNSKLLFTLFSELYALLSSLFLLKQSEFIPASLLCVFCFVFK